MCAPEKRIIVIFSFYVNFGSSASFDILCFSVPCRVLFRCVLSFSYPFPWHISRVFFPLPLPGHIRHRFLRSLFKKSEETRAQFPHLPLLSPHPFQPLVFVAFLAFLLHSTCVSCFFSLLIRNVADSARLIPPLATPRLVLSSRSVSPSNVICLLMCPFVQLTPPSPSSPVDVLLVIHCEMFNVERVKIFQ